MSLPRRIALFLEAAQAYDRGVIQGIAQYALSRDAWSFAIDLPRPWQLDLDAPRQRPDGVIVNLTQPEQIKRIQALRLPAVNIGEALEHTPFPLVTYDQRAIGITAADHLLQTGLKRFAYVGHRGLHGCDLRGEAFVKRITDAGYRADRFKTEPPPACAIDELAVWLTSMPTPVGIFACDDRKARDVLEAARLANRHVPEDIAVVGCDDDALVNALASPPLSSVRVPAEAVGAAAAKLLDRLIDGAKPPAQPTRFGPFGIAARRSSDALILDDADLITAIRYIRDHADQPLQVTDVLESVAMSRRSLERRFREHLGRSPQQEIQRVHLERARELLADTDLPIAQVAGASGFRNADRLAAVFRANTGLTPSAYRDRFRQH